ncbi:hypothetical protein ACA910_006777 [Epithemia clementina (nom. ined.)]
MVNVTSIRVEPDSMSRAGRAFGIVFASAAATSVGSLAVFYPRLAKYATARVLGASLGFATGVMMYVSLVDIYNKSLKGFREEGHDEDTAFLFTTLSFFGGIASMKIIDVLIHTFANSSEFQAVEAGMEQMAARNNGDQGSSAAIGSLTNDSSLERYCSNNNKADLDSPFDLSSTQPNQHQQSSLLEKQTLPLHLHSPPPPSNDDKEEEAMLSSTTSSQHPPLTTVVANKNPTQSSTFGPSTVVEYSQLPTDPSNNSNISNLSIPKIHQVFEVVEHGFVPNNSNATSSFITGNGYYSSPHRRAPPPPTIQEDEQQQSPPHHDRNHQQHDNMSRSVGTHGTTTEERKSLFKMGATTAMAIALHNFPEGLVTFVAYLEDPAVGVAMAIGIAMHNIPEGLCVSMPIYYATGSRWKAFFWGSFSGFSEPFGAFVGYLILHTSISGNTYGILFGVVAGMMVFISIDELLPMAFKFDPSGSIITGASVMGMLLVAVSVLLFRLGDE